MLSTKFKSLKKLAALSAIATVCGVAKADTKTADFMPVQTDTNAEIENISLMPNGQLMVKSNGKIGTVDTPYMFVNTNETNFASQGFVPQEMATANSVIASGNTVYFTTTNGNVNSFTLNNNKDLNGVRTDNIKTLGKLNDARIVGAKDDNIFVTYKNNENEFYLTSLNVQTHLFSQPKVIAEPKLSSFDENKIYLLDKKGKLIAYDINQNLTQTTIRSQALLTPFATTMTVCNNTVYIGTDNGEIYVNKNAQPSIIGTGKITSLSNDGTDVIYTCSGTNSIFTLSSNTPKKTLTEEPKSAIVSNGVLFFAQRKKLGFDKQ